MTIATKIAERDASAPARQEGRRGRSSLGQTLAVEAFAGFVLCAWAWRIAVPGRVDALPSVFLEIGVVTLIVAGLTLRDPDGLLRLSNPALSLVGWMIYYFIKPTLDWLEGYRMTFEASAGIVLDAAMVSSVQDLHCYFMVGLFAAYFAIAPREVVTSIAIGKVELKPVPFLLVGLGPYLWTFVERVVTTGSIMPSASYGEFMAMSNDSLVASRTAGGADYLITQIFSKLWYFPIMGLGLGLGILITRYMAEKRWGRLSLLFASVPLLLILGTGARSYTAYPYLLGLVIADGLTGPYRWWRTAPLAFIAVRAFDFYGVYRGYQQQSFQNAMDSSLRTMEGMSNTLQTEDSAMLTKEAYCVFLVDHGREYQGPVYFFNMFIQLLPAQIAPEKMSIVTTGDFLGNEILGYGRYASGVAGAMLGDGYLMGGTVGVVILAVVLGATFALVVRWGMSGKNGRPVLWRYLLMLMISIQSTQYIRADYNVVLVQILYYVILPAILLNLLSGGKLVSRSGLDLELEVRP